MQEIPDTVRYTVSRLSMLGWKQKGIGEAVEMTQQAVSLNLQEISKLVKLVKSAFHEGKTVEKIAEDGKLDIITAYALLPRPHCSPDMLVEH